MASIRRWGHLLILPFAFLAAMILLGVSTWKGNTFIDDRVGSAGEWFAGVGGFLVFWWAVGEPQRQRAREDRREGYRRIAAARSVTLFDRSLPTLGPLIDAELGVQSGVAKQLCGRVGNYSGAPIRIVRLLIEWTRESMQDVSRARDFDPDQNLWSREAGKLYEFTLADALPPNEEVDLDRPHQGLYFGFGEDRGLNRDIAHLRIMFFDVHGDEWIGWFGPQDNLAHIQLHDRKSAFWTGELRELIPPVPNENLSYVAASAEQRKSDSAD